MSTEASASPITYKFLFRWSRVRAARYDGIEGMARVGSIVAPLHFVPPSFSLPLRSKLIYLHFIMQSRHACTTGDLYRRYFNVETCRGEGAAANVYRIVRLGEFLSRPETCGKILGIRVSFRFSCDLVSARCWYPLVKTISEEV